MLKIDTKIRMQEERAAYDFPRLTAAFVVEAELNDADWHNFSCSPHQTH